MRPTFLVINLQNQIVHGTGLLVEELLGARLYGCVSVLMSPKGRKGFDTKRLKYQICGIVFIFSTQFFQVPISLLVNDSFGECLNISKWST